MRGFKYIISILICLFISDAIAGINTWTSVGPTGGDVAGLVLDPLSTDRLYALTNLIGQVKSSDGGKTWSYIKDAPYISQLVSIGSTLYAATYGGLSVSTDDGDTWSALSDKLPIGGNSLSSLAVIGSQLYASINGGIYLSADGGMTWTDVGQNLIGFYVSRLFADGTTLYAISGDYLDSPIYRSSDGGVTWVDVSYGLDKFIYGGVYISSLITDGSSLYALTDTGLFKSIDGGSTWTDITDAWNSIGLSDSPLPLILFCKDNVVYAGTTWYGLFISQDGGASWSPSANSGLIGSEALWYGNSGTTIYASTARDGMFISKDLGNSWSASNTGLTARHIDTLIAGRSILIARITGLSTNTYVSSDGGNTWDLDATLSNFNGPYWKEGDAIFASYGPGSVAISNDGGSNWAFVNVDESKVIGSVTSFAAIGSTVFAGTGSQGVYKSSDGGSTWEQTNISSTESILSLAAFDSTLYVSTNHSFIKSTDGGISTQDINSNLELPITTLFATKSAVFATNNQGLFVSVDNGASWLNSSNAMGATSVGVLITRDNEIYAGTAGKGIFVSNDQGNTWSSINSGLPMPDVFTSLAFVGNTLYAGSVFTGVYANTIIAPPSFDDSSPPGGTVGRAYYFQYQSSGTSPITYSLVSGSLPSGLNLSSDGVISGTPSKTGTYSWTVSASNGANPNSVKASTVTINEVGGGGNIDLFLLMLLTLRFCLREWRPI